MPFHFPRSDSWMSEHILADVSKSNINLWGETLAKASSLFEFDMYTEYDSELLYQYISAQRKDLDLSEEFSQFLHCWRHDENNHYRGYRRLLSLSTGRAESELHTVMLKRTPNFSVLREFIEDEFSLCIILAYDEIVTVNSCRMDFPLFTSMNNRSCVKWIQLVARDEAFHFLNLVDVIKRYYPHRLGEVLPLLKRLRKYESRDNNYQSTFIMDHDSNRFSAYSLDFYCQKLLQILYRQSRQIKT